MRTWSRFAFLRAISCNGMLAHEQYMFGENAYTGLSKDVRGSIANADLVINIIFGARRVS
jgi:hypothetical protein